jgi:hypothetical protein
MFDSPSSMGATATLLAAMFGLLATMAHGFHWI